MAKKYSRKHSKRASRRMKQKDSKTKSKRTSRRSHKGHHKKRRPSRVRFGSTNYQNEVNGLTGAMGPSQPAMWADTQKTTGEPWSMGAQPLYYSPNSGVYVTAYDSNAAPNNVISEKQLNFGNYGTWNPSTGPAFGKRRRYRKTGYTPKKIPIMKVRRMNKGNKRKSKSLLKKKGSRFGSCGSCSIPVQPLVQAPPTISGFGHRTF